MRIANFDNLLSALLGSATWFTLG